MQGSCNEDAKLLIWYPVGSGNLIDMGDTVGKYCHATNRFCQPPIACSTCGYRNTHRFCDGCFVLLCDTLNTSDWQNMCYS